MMNRTLLEAWEAFENSGSKDITLCQSALFRFTVLGLGGRKPSGARLTSKEIAATLKLLATIPISFDIAERLREAQAKTFQMLNTPKKRQRQPRYYLNQFITWATQNEFFFTAQLPKEKPQYTFYPKKISKIKITNRSRVSKYAFSFDASDYEADSGVSHFCTLAFLNGLGAIGIWLLLGIILQKWHLHRIAEEFSAFRKYQITNQGNREITANNHELQLKMILGWLYHEKNIPLSELSLQKIIPFIRLNFRIKEFSSEKNPWLAQIIAKAKALEDIKDEAHSLVELLNEYFAWSPNPLSPTTKRFYLDSLIAYAKYVYRSETDKTMALNFEDIPLINRLKVFSKEITDGQKNKVRSSTEYLPWPNVLEVLEKLRFEADLKNTKDKRKRPITAQATSLQNFVLLGFFILVPPSRQRVVRELELGRTLKYGLMNKAGRFIPANQLSPGEAKYYIHLRPEDYKTGDIYGEWLGEFPNTEFSDGSHFYDYLNRWLFQGYQDANGNWHGMRELIAQPGAKTVFLRDVAGQPHDCSSMSNKIKSIFTRWTETPLSPHDLRHLYRTYIDDPETEATQAEKESTAHWMRHSEKTAAETYCHLDNEQKLRAGAQLANRINAPLAKRR